MEARIIELESLIIAGFPVYGTPESGLFTQAWHEFLPRYRNADSVLDRERAFGVEIYPGPWQDGMKWIYLAGAQVLGSATPPHPLVSYIVPAHRYASCDVLGGVAAIPAGFQFLYKEWIPSNGYVDTGVFDLELYDERFLGEDNPKSVVTLLVPVQPLG